MAQLDKFVVLNNVSGGNAPNSAHSEEPERSDSAALLANAEALTQTEKRAPLPNSLVSG